MLSGCATQPGKTAVHQNVGKSGQGMPKRVLFLPADIRLHELSAGGVAEKVDAWSSEASANATRVVNQIATSRHPFQIVDSPELSAEERAILEEHIALYDAVAGSAYFARTSMFKAWQDRGREFDYTLGPGLKALAERTNVDAALILSGSDYISTGGRKAAMLMGALLGAVTGVVVMPGGGVSFVSVGVVDLRSGDLLWFGTDQSGSTNFQNEADLRSMIEGLFNTYPGIAPAVPPAKPAKAALAN
jgi:hypothetical protein